MENVTTRADCVPGDVVFSVNYNLNVLKPVIISFITIGRNGVPEYVCHSSFDNSLTVLSSKEFEKTWFLNRKQAWDAVISNIACKK